MLERPPAACGILLNNKCPPPPSPSPDPCGCPFGASSPPFSPNFPSSDATLTNQWDQPCNAGAAGLSEDDEGITAGYGDQDDDDAGGDAAEGKEDDDDVQGDEGNVGQGEDDDAQGNDNDVQGDDDVAQGDELEEEQRETTMTYGEDEVSVDDTLYEIAYGSGSDNEGTGDAVPLDQDDSEITADSAGDEGGKERQMEGETYVRTPFLCCSWGGGRVVWSVRGSVHR